MPELLLPPSSPWVPRTGHCSSPVAVWDEGRKELQGQSGCSDIVGVLGLFRARTNLFLGMIKSTGEQSRSLSVCLLWRREVSLGGWLLSPPAVSPQWRDVPKVAVGIPAGTVGLLPVQLASRRGAGLSQGAASSPGQQWSEARGNLRREPSSHFNR